jgi:hypothetical protein
MKKPIYNNTFKYGTPEYDRYIEQFDMNMNIYHCQMAPRQIGLLLTQVEQGTKSVWDAANALAMWSFGGRAKGVTYEARLFEREFKSCYSAPYNYNEISTEKVLHYTVVRQLRKHKEVARQILRVITQPECLSAAYFGGREEMFQFIKRVEREMALPV